VADSAQEYEGLAKPRASHRGGPDSVSSGCSPVGGVPRIGTYVWPTRRPEASCHILLDMLRMRASVWQIRGATLVAVVGLLMLLLTSSAVVQTLGLVLLAGGGGSALGGVMQRRRARIQAHRHQKDQS
jgi:hypothetical protein